MILGYHPGLSHLRGTTFRNIYISPGSLSARLVCPFLYSALIFKYQASPDPSIHPSFNISIHISIHPSVSSYFLPPHAEHPRRQHHHLQHCSYVMPSYHTASTRPSSQPKQGHKLSPKPSSSSSSSSSSSPSNVETLRYSMDNSRPRVEIMRCSRCAKTVETVSTTGSDGLRRVSTDDASANGMVRFGTNLYYCDRCARMVGYK
jgi:hypothetical protein